MDALKSVGFISPKDFEARSSDLLARAPIEQWPDDIADCVKAIRHTPFGPTVVMYDKLRALELMAIAGGELRQKVDHKDAPFDLAAYLRAEPPAEDE